MKPTQRPTVHKTLLVPARWLHLITSFNAIPAKHCSTPADLRAFFAWEKELTVSGWHCIAVEEVAPYFSKVHIASRYGIRGCKVVPFTFAPRPNL